MIAIFYILKKGEIVNFSIFKASKEDLVNLTHTNFKQFNKSYAVSPQMSFIEILEMEDDFIDFISDVDEFITLNESSAKDILEIIESCFYVDVTNKKTVQEMAKEKAIKFNVEESNKSIYLAKVLLMVFRKQILNLFPVEKDINIKPSIVVEKQPYEQVMEVKIESQGLVIEGLALDINFYIEHDLTKNTMKLFQILKQAYENQEEISLCEFIDNKCTNFKVFFTLMNELVEKEVISNIQLTELKNIYFGLKENTRYQEYIKKAILNGAEIGTLKEQLDLYYYLRG